MSDDDLSDDADDLDDDGEYPTLCPYCDGSGLGQSWDNNTVCSQCRGSGVVRQVEPDDE